MPIDFTALNAALAELSTTASAVETAFKTPVTTAADQASIDAATASVKSASDAMTAAIPPTS